MISICLATYNGEKHISQQLNSIFEQSFQEWKIYIHDDGSTDKTMDIIYKYKEKYPDKIFIVEGSPTGGAKNNFFYLLQQVESDYYMFCDQDDFWLEDKIKLTFNEMKKLESNRDIPCLIFTELKVVNEKLEVISEKISSYQKLDCTNFNLNYMIVQNNIFGCTTMINKSLRDKMLRYKNIDNIIMHDWWAGIVASKFGKIKFLDESTMLYRQHSKNDVGAQKVGLFLYIKTFLLKRDDIKKSLSLNRIQAKEFVESFNLPKDSPVAVYSNIESYGKFKRLYFYKKYGFKKSSKIKNIGMWLFG